MPARPARLRSGSSSPTASGFSCLSDIVMFSALFASLRGARACDCGRPDRRAAVQSSQRRDRNRLSSCLELHLRADVAGRQFAAALSVLIWSPRSRSCLGAAFLALEIREFAGMIAIGAAPQRSAFLSAFFTLVGCHGLHVTAGLIWLTVMMAQVAIQGISPPTWSAACSASPCSGTRSTSSGSGCSRSSI